MGKLQSILCCRMWHKTVRGKKSLVHYSSGFRAYGSGHRQSVRQSFTPEKLAGLQQILLKRRVFSPEDIRNIASYFKLQESKCRIWFKENGARLRRQACSVRISPDMKKNSSDKRKSFVLKVRKRRSAVSGDSVPRKKKSVSATTPSSANADARPSCSRRLKSSLNAKATPETPRSALESQKKGNIHDADFKSTSKTSLSSIVDENDSTSCLMAAAEIKQEACESDVSTYGGAATSGTATMSSGPAASSPDNQRGGDKFFHDLPYDKQITLLKRTENLTYASSADAHQLATELSLPAKSVFSWLKSKCMRNLRLWNKKLTRQKVAKLNEELGCAVAAAPDAPSSVLLTEDRALMLSYELDLSIHAIRKWFERKRSELRSDEDGVKPEFSSAADRAGNSTADESEGGATSASKPVVLVRQCQTRTLPPPTAEALRENASNACVSNSAASVSLSSPSSFSCDVENEPVTSSPSSVSLSNVENDPLKKRRYVLTLRQKKTLAHQFQTSQCVSPSEAAELSTKLNLPVKAIQLWFHRKRLEAKKLLVPRQADDEVPDVEGEGGNQTSVDEVEADESEADESEADDIEADEIEVDETEADEVEADEGDEVVI